MTSFKLDYATRITEYAHWKGEEKWWMREGLEIHSVISLQEASSIFKDIAQLEWLFEISDIITLKKG